MIDARHIDRSFAARHTTRPDVSNPNAAPTTSFTVDASTSEGEVRIIDTSTDDTSVAAIDIDWGDGTVQTSLTPGQGYQHTYATSGAYTITLTANDGAGLTDTQAQDVTVEKLWTPAELGADLIAWRGVDDDSTLTLRDDGGSDRVERWADRSGNGYDMTQSTATAQPAYDGSAVVFDGVDDFLADALPTTQSYDFYFVSSTEDAEWVYPASETQTSFFGFAGDDESTNALLSAGYGSPSLMVDAADVSPATRDDIHTLITAGVLISHQNADISGWPDIGFGVFGGASVEFYFAGSLRAFIATTTSISTDDQQRLEGYLAHVYTETAALPAEHPYKSTPPLV